jgi:hypothetical protein
MIDRKSRVHVANVRYRDGEYVVVLSSGDEVSWNYWISLTQEERFAQ